ncbi:hypothetical protein [Aporhodopirellula aestuarii]|uniref:Heme exporter protein D n=1 Tax=Aporhodopirellula aestuarii TaxID=2950107 RepID=A0ABT0U0B2_9BACT|nr:hypothetical protein [Aporhodopirellula aestuarii]MCM2370181.1 hypothetical protein [Aporhodopirellula aestuarii]
MNGFPKPSLFAHNLFAQGIFSSINWLWVAGAIVAAYFILAAMGRRQNRLTELLRSHVKKTTDANLPPEPAQDIEDSPK